MKASQIRIWHNLVWIQKVKLSHTRHKKCSLVSVFLEHQFKFSVNPRIHCLCITLQLFPPVQSDLAFPLCHFVTTLLNVPVYLSAFIPGFIFGNIPVCMWLFTAFLHVFHCFGLNKKRHILLRMLKPLENQISNHSVLSFRFRTVTCSKSSFFPYFYNQELLLKTPIFASHMLSNMDFFCYRKIKISQKISMFRNILYFCCCLRKKQNWKYFL